MEVNVTLDWPNHEHPRGCECYWCVYCDCPELIKREQGQAQASVNPS